MQVPSAGRTRLRLPDSPRPVLRAAAFGTRPTGHHTYDSHKLCLLMAAAQTVYTLRTYERAKKYAVANTERVILGATSPTRLEEVNVRPLGILV